MSFYFKMKRFEAQIEKKFQRGRFNVQRCNLNSNESWALAPGQKNAPTRFGDAFDQCSDATINEFFIVIFFLPE